MPIDFDFLPHLTPHELARAPSFAIRTQSMLSPHARRPARCALLVASYAEELRRRADAVPGVARVGREVLV